MFGFLKETKKGNKAYSPKAKLREEENSLARLCSIRYQFCKNFFHFVGNGNGTSRALFISLDSNGLEMTISHYGLYSVGYSVVWCGPGPVARTGIQKVLCRDLPNINLLQNTQQLRTHFCGWSIHEVMLIERGNILLDTCKHHLHISSGYHNIIQLFCLFTALLKYMGVLKYHWGKPCRVDLVFSWTEITKGYIGTVKLSIIILTTTSLITFLLREILSWHRLRSEYQQTKRHRDFCRIPNYPTQATIDTIKK